MRVILTLMMMAASAANADSLRSLNLGGFTATACGDFDGDRSTECIFEATGGGSPRIYDPDVLGMPIPVLPVGPQPSSAITFDWRVPRDVFPSVAFGSVVPTAYVLRYFSTGTGAQSVRVIDSACALDRCQFAVALPSGAYTWDVQATSPQGNSARTAPTEFTIP